MYRDPAAALLLPILGSGAVTTMSPKIEHWANLLIGGPLVLLAVGTVARMAWLWWGPLPDVDRVQDERRAIRERALAVIADAEPAEPAEVAR
jgi:hypothetical protein